MVTVAFQLIDLGVMLLLLRSSGNQQIKIFGTTMCRERSESLNRLKIRAQKGCRSSKRGDEDHPNNQEDALIKGRARASCARDLCRRMRTHCKN